MSDRQSIRVLGQIEGLYFSELEVWAEGGLVCLSIAGPDGKAYATAPPELGQVIASAIRAAVREASAQLPVISGDGMLWAGVTLTAGKTPQGRVRPGA